MIAEVEGVGVGVVKVRCLVWGGGGRWERENWRDSDHHEQNVAHQHPASSRKSVAENLPLRV